MTWFVLGLAPPWMFFMVVGIKLVAAILEGRDDDEVKQWQRTDKWRAEIEAKAALNERIAKVVPGGSLVLEDRLRRLAATRKVQA